MDTDSGAQGQAQALAPETLSGAEIFIRCLLAEGATTVFGYPGGAVLHIYDELHKQREVDHILVRHEQGAVHAAEGYAKSTGKTGVVLVTSGPGATNAVTGIADAYLDSVPLVVFTGQVRTAVIGNDAFQEVDTVGITRPCVKHNILVKRVEELPLAIKRAFHLAGSGRPGPVVVDIPKDVTEQRMPFAYPEDPQMRSYQPTLTGHAGQIKRAARLMMKAERPVIYSGGGVVASGAHAELTEFARLTGFPITNTLMGLGAYPGTDPQFIQMLGMHGSYEANMAMHECDVLIAVGARFDDRITGRLDKFCPYARVVHIDVDPSSISKNFKAHVPIVGDAGRVLAALTRELRAGGYAKPDIAAWWERIHDWAKRDSFAYRQEMDGPIKPQYVVDRLYRLTEGAAFVTSDVGQHQMWVAQLYKFERPRRWINSGGLGTMGFGLPAAMGVQLAHPGALVCCVTGEASIQMCIQELSTCRQYGLPIKIINLNNRYMGMVRQWQDFFYDSRYAMSYMDALPDFVKLAESYGHAGLRVERPGDVDGALREMLARRAELVFADFVTDQTENVFPMIAPGAAHNEMILS